MALLQAKSEEVSHVQATWEHHENTMIDAQLQLADLKLVLEAAQKAEAEAQVAREAAEAQLAAQSSELDRARSRLAGAEAELDEVRSEVGLMTGVQIQILDIMSWQQLHCGGRLASTHHLQGNSASSISYTAKFRFCLLQDDTGAVQGGRNIKAAWL